MGSPQQCFTCDLTANSAAATHLLNLQLRRYLRDAIGGLSPTKFLDRLAEQGLVLTIRPRQNLLHLTSKP